ncbi:MAG TPA: hypothetical protein DEQ02_10465 [Ruminococcaceae bacterium]|nr:hypothetical protein [Oscillospiraceae bacterium]
MKQNLFDSDIAPMCQYCLHGRISQSNLGILCVKCGIVDESFSCGKFKYDPLKRVPKAFQSLPEYTHKDFALNQDAS